MTIGLFAEFDAVVRHRPAYKGRPLKPGMEAINGERVRLQVVGMQDDDEKYPGELMLEPVDEATQERWRSLPLRWIASGDVEVVEVVRSGGIEGGYSLDSLDPEGFTIAGRGQVLPVACPVTVARDELLTLLGPTVKVDGKRYTLRGVESHCVPVISAGTPIGLLVEPQQ